MKARCSCASVWYTMMTLVRASTPPRVHLRLDGSISLIRQLPAPPTSDAYLTQHFNQGTFYFLPHFYFFSLHFSTYKQPERKRNQIRNKTKENRKNMYPRRQHLSPTKHVLLLLSLATAFSTAAAADDLDCSKPITLDISGSQRQFDLSSLAGEQTVRRERGTPPLSDGRRAQVRSL